MALRKEMDNLNMSMKKQKEHSDRTLNDWIVVREAFKKKNQKVNIC